MQCSSLNTSRLLVFLKRIPSCIVLVPCFACTAKLEQKETFTMEPQGNIVLRNLVFSKRVFSRQIKFFLFTQIKK